MSVFTKEFKKEISDEVEGFKKEIYRVIPSVLMAVAMGTSMAVPNITLTSYESTTERLLTNNPEIYPTEEIAQYHAKSSAELFAGLASGLGFGIFAGGMYLYLSRKEDEDEVKEVD